MNERFQYGGRIDRSTLAIKLKEADIIVFIDNFYGLQIPGKLFDTLALNKPILFIYENDHSPTLKYLVNYEGIFYSKNKTNEIINQLNEILKCPKNIYDRNINCYYWEYLINKSIFYNEIK